MKIFSRFKGFDCNLGLLTVTNVKVVKREMSIPYEFSAKTIIKEGRTTKANIQEIKQWSKLALLPQLQDEMICLFLLSCHNNIASTQATIRAYFRTKSDAAEIFEDRDIDNEILLKTMTVIIACSLPARMPNNTVIHYFRLSDTNYKNFDLITCMKIGFMVIDVSQRYDPPNELVVIIDMKGASFMHLTCVKLGAVKKFFDYMQEAMPLRIQKIHVLNTTYLFDKILAIAKLFMKTELMNIIVPHSPDFDLEEFYRNHVPASCLPKDYGGTLPTTGELNQMTIQQFREMKEFFQAEEDLIRGYRDSQS